MKITGTHEFKIEDLFKMEEFVYQGLGEFSPENTKVANVVCTQDVIKFIDSAGEGIGTIHNSYFFVFCSKSLSAFLSGDLEIFFGVPRIDKESETLSIDFAAGTEHPLNWDIAPEVFYQWESIRAKEAAEKAGPEASRYFRTVVSYEVLSRDTPFSGSAEDLAMQIVDGDCSGIEWSRIVAELSPRIMAKHLIAQGSDADFLVSEEDQEAMEDDDVVAVSPPRRPKA